MSDFTVSADVQGRQLGGPLLRLLRGVSLLSVRQQVAPRGGVLPAERGRYQGGRRGATHQGQPGRRGDPQYLPPALHWGLPW